MTRPLFFACAVFALLMTTVALTILVLLSRERPKT